MIRPSYLREHEDECQCVASGLSERHNEDYECRQCGKCCGDEPMLTESFADYNDKGICIPCSLENGEDIHEIAGVFNKC